MQITGKKDVVTKAELQKKYRKEYYARHRNEAIEYSRRYREGHRKEALEYSKKYYEEHKKEVAAYKRNYGVERREAIAAQRREYRANHRKELNARALRRKQEKPEYRMLCNLRTRLLQVLKDNSKSGRTVELIGCSAIRLRQHIEKQFKEGMTWGNYGRRGWHIDHKKPCALFDLSKAEEQRKCFHYTNLQPMWGIDNMRKNSRYDGGKRPGSDV